MKDTKIIIGEWLEEKRNARGWSLQEASDKFGYSKSAIHTWEKGKRTIYADTLMDYCECLGADPDELVARVKKEQGRV